jgi:hypothetical protein
MNPLLTVVLFWAVVTTAMLLFGMVCIKCGVYTSGGRDYPPSLEI